MSNFYNPFRDNRTEQMKDLWKYYVPFPGMNGSAKPIVVEGGRGSGKTMFFQCNSWRQKLLEIKKKGDSSSALLNGEFIGIYYRVDTTFVSSMSGSVPDSHDWQSVFETYLGIVVLQEFIDLLDALNSDMRLEPATVISFVKFYSSRLCLNGSNEIDSLSGFKSLTCTFLDAVEDMINGVRESSNKIRFVTAHRFITDLCNSFSSIVKKEMVFKIFIDEYETLQPYQQRIVNTLIKHSTLPVVFNIGLRPKGMKTNQTISDSETIEAPHDYDECSLCIEEANYKAILIDICKKRIELGKELEKIPSSAQNDINYYLQSYSIDYEVDKISKANVELSYRTKLKKIIIDNAETEGYQAEDYCNVLCDTAPILNSRLHYALLCKKTPYSPSIRELYTEYKNNTEKYRDWMHNRKNGVVYLLCQESKRGKMYFGFDSFVALSSFTVRYFLELCERAFYIASDNGFDWNRPITPEEQTEAARYVSDYKITDISGYEPYGKDLRVFIQYLGRIFYKLHTDEKTTLGEPEPNHFSTKDLSLSDEIRQRISSAIMWNVLQADNPTKRKQSLLSPETVDYYMTKIYAPYFGISYRNQRKIQLSVDILKDLFSGDEKKAQEAFSRFFKEKSESDFNTSESSLSVEKQPALF